MKDQNTRAIKSLSVRADLNAKVIDELINFDLKLKEFNTSLLEYTLAEALSRKNVVSCVVGIRDMKQIKEIIHNINKKVPFKNLKKFEPKNISNLINLGEPQIN